MVVEVKRAGFGGLGVVVAVGGAAVEALPWTTIDAYVGAVAVAYEEVGAVAAGAEYAMGADAAP